MGGQSGHLSCFIEVDTEIWRKGTCPSPYREWVLKLISEAHPAGYPPLWEPRQGPTHYSGAICQAAGGLRHALRASQASRGGRFTIPPGPRSESALSGQNYPHSFSSGPFHFMSQRIYLHKERVSDSSCRNIILLNIIFKGTILKSAYTYSHSSGNVCVGAGAMCWVGRKSTCCGENSVTLGFPERRAIPLGAHCSERARDCPTPSKFALSGSSERPGRSTPRA